MIGKKKTNQHELHSTSALVGCWAYVTHVQNPYLVYVSACLQVHPLSLLILASIADNVMQTYDVQHSA